MEKSNGRALIAADQRHEEKTKPHSVLARREYSLGCRIPGYRRESPSPETLSLVATSDMSFRARRLWRISLGSTEWPPLSVWWMVRGGSVLRLASRSISAFSFLRGSTDLMGAIPPVTGNNGRMWGSIP